eukprot:468588-Rhodomonas_salina.2
MWLASWANIGTIREHAGCPYAGSEFDALIRGGCQSGTSPRNHAQETAFLVQIVLKMRFLVLDFGV